MTEAEELEKLRNENQALKARVKELTEKLDSLNIAAGNFSKSLDAENKKLKEEIDRLQEELGLTK
jgi:cell division protein FtsB